LEDDMADNVPITAGTGTNIKTDQLAGGEHVQYMKMMDGLADSETVVKTNVGVAANALRVALATSSEIIANLSATDNAVIDAIQTAVEACQTALEATITVDGTVTANLSATDNAVLDAIQAAVEIIDNAISGSEMQVDIVSSAAIPVTDNDGALTVDGTVTANLSATDNAVLDAIQTAVELIDNAISGTEMQVDVASIAAGENHVGQVGMDDDCITITCSLDTNAYADGDVLFATQEIAGAVRNNGDSCILQSVHVVDIDDQGIEMDLIFFNAATALGTENAAPDIDDTEVLTTLGSVNVDTYLDLGANQIATVDGIGLVLEAGAATTSLYVAGITRGTPTHSASGLQITFGFLRN
jgi:hypothetical protein